MTLSGAVDVSNVDNKFMVIDKLKKSNQYTNDQHWIMDDQKPISS